MIRLVSLLFILTSLSATSYAQEEKMDLETHNLVIQKLERVLEAAEAPAKKSDLQLRLADLYAEKARLSDMNEIEKGCNDCSTSKSDRQKSLKLYEAALANADKSQKAKIIFQTAHLLEMTGQPKEANKFYKRVVKNDGQIFSQDVIAASYLGLGELAFNKGDYNEAQKNYKKSLAIKQGGRKGYLTYRLAWCQFQNNNLKQAQQTIKSVLTNPEFLKKADGSYDSSFHEEVSRDYATFLSKGKVEKAQIDSLASLSPEVSKKENLEYLASELDRLGKKGSALLVWNMLGTNPTNTDDKFENVLRMAQGQYDIGNKEATTIEIQNFSTLWKNESCGSKENCEGYRTRLRKLITAWGKAEEKEPTEHLVKAYAIYTEIFPDVDMNYWGAQSARKINQYGQAVAFYRNASVLAKEGNNRKILEGSLLGEIEMAELSKNIEARRNAYNHYLDFNSNGEKNMEVRYQLARLLYEEQKYNDAANAFRDFALTNDKSATKLRIQAADLSLDSLVLSKNTSNIEPWALEYAHVFPSKHNDYTRIARKATLNVVAVQSDKDAEDALAKLTTVKLDGATEQERIDYWRNRLVLAERVKNLNEVNLAANQLLAIRGISKQDRELALSRKAWVAELTLDFKTAYKITKSLDTGKLKADERALKLAMLAELAGYESLSLYKKYLSVSRDSVKARMIMAKLVRESISPAATLRQYQSALKKDMKLYSTLALEIFAKRLDVKFARETLADKRMLRTTGGAAMARYIFAQDFNKVSNQINRHKLIVSNPILLRKTLNARLQMLNQLEAQANRGIRSGDWTLQILTLSKTAEQYHRLAHEIKSMPVPRNLKVAQKAQYQQLLERQARPYMAKAERVDSQLERLWNRSDIIDSLTNDYKTARESLKNLLASEIKTLASLAPRSQQRELISSLSDREEKPTASRIASARQSVQENPFNIGKLEQLKSLEEKAGRTTIVAYLDARLNQLQKGVVQ